MRFFLWRLSRLVRAKAGATACEFGRYYSTRKGPEERPYEWDRAFASYLARTLGRWSAFLLACLRQIHLDVAAQAFLSVCWTRVYERLRAFSGCLNCDLSDLGDGL